MRQRMAINMKSNEVNMRTGPLDDPLLWTMEETARQCAVSRRTVQRWVNDGSLPVVRFGCRATRIPEFYDCYHFLINQHFKLP